MVCLTSMGSSRIGPLVAAGVLATTLVGATGGGVVGPTWGYRHDGTWAFRQPAYRSHFHEVELVGG